jgi:hypothetical protein
VEWHLFGCFGYVVGGLVVYDSGTVRTWLIRMVVLVWDGCVFSGLGFGFFVVCVGCLVRAPEFEPL